MITSPTIILPNWDGTSTPCTVEVSRYANDRLALKLWCEDGPYGTITVNLPDQHLNEGEFFVKDWSENELLAEALLELGWIERTGREVVSGFIAPMVARAAGPLKHYLDALAGE